MESFGECCGSTVLTAACYWPSSHCIPAQRFVSVSGGVKSQPLTLGVGLRRRCVLSPLLFIVYYMNRIYSHSQVNRVSQLGAAGSTVYFLWTILCCLNLLNGVFSIHWIGFHLCATDAVCCVRPMLCAVCDRYGMKISAKQTEASLRILRHSTYPRQSMLQVSGNILQQVDKFKHFGVVFPSDGRRNKGLIHGLVKQTQFCVNFIALCLQNGSFQTPQSCQFSNQSLFRSSPMV